VWTYGTALVPRVVVGELCSKSNGRQIVRFGHRLASIKGDKARQYVVDFMRQVPVSKTPLVDEPVALYARCYYKDNRRDLDVALLQDCIQKACIINNDRQVKEIHAWRYLDKLWPRVEFWLSRIGGEDAGQDLSDNTDRA
jgi:Holliday junction resolvase RusA-like endonuclease